MFTIKYIITDRKVHYPVSVHHSTTIASPPLEHHASTFRHPPPPHPGITMIEFAQMEPPNNEMHPNRVLIRINKASPPTLDRPSKWSADFNDILVRCLVKDPSERFDSQQLLSVGDDNNCRYICVVTR